MPYYTVASTKSKTRSRPEPPSTAKGVTDPALAVSRAADAVVEAACIVAVLGVPLYFTANGYEPDKALLLRALACLAGGAWLIGSWLRPRISPGSWRSRPILLFALLLFGSYCISTIVSIDPRLSFWGSHGRQEGLWTRAAYLIFLVVIATRFRREAQIQRLVSALLIGSVPLVLYGFGQEFGYTPVPYTASPDTAQWPVWSSFGQHVFFGSYLVLVIPITLSRLLPTSEAWFRPAPGWYRAPVVLLPAAALVVIVVLYFSLLSTGINHIALFALLPAVLALFACCVPFLSDLPSSDAFLRAQSLGYSVLLVLQCVTLVYTGARAAWLGILASLPVFGFLVARRMGRPAVARQIMVTTLLAGVILIALNIPNGPLQPLRTIHGLSRIANITDSGGSEGSAQGRLLIWQGVGHLMTTDPAIGGTWGGPGRLLVGYGPESMVWAFEQVFPLKLRQVNSEINVWDRAHNIYLDQLIDAGIVGLLLFLCLLAAAFWRIVTRLRTEASTEGWILIGAAAALAGHLVDGFFSIETVASLLNVFVLLGIVARRRIPEEDEAREHARPSREPLLWLLGCTVLTAAGLLLFSTDDHPAVVGIVWILGTIGGVAAYALTTVGALRSRLVLPRTRWVGLAMVTLLVALGLGSQERFETAAVADRAAVTALGTYQYIDAIAYMQQAVHNNAVDEQYRTDLADPYLILAQSRGDSGEPTYVPTPQDSRTVDPSLASNLGKDQLFTLAEFALQGGHSLAPLDPDQYDNLGTLYKVWGRPDAALAQFRTAEALSTNNPRYLDEVAQIQLAVGKNRLALTTARTALGLDTTFWLSHCTLAIVEHKLGNTTGARQEASLARYWARNYWPPPFTQLDQTCGFDKTG